MWEDLGRLNDLLEAPQFCPFMQSKKMNGEL